MGGGGRKKIDVKGVFFFLYSFDALFSCKDGEVENVSGLIFQLKIVQLPHVT
jgi:hypothetical protein